MSAPVGDTIRKCYFFQTWERKTALGTAPHGVSFEIIDLCLADRMVAFVIEDKDFNGQGLATYFLAYNRLEFLDVHLDASVAG